jgi:hypothetical protein
VIRRKHPVIPLPVLPRRGYEGQPIRPEGENSAKACGVIGFRCETAAGTGLQSCLVLLSGSTATRTGSAEQPAALSHQLFLQLVISSSAESECP